MIDQYRDAFGQPGIPPTFAAGDKDAVTTALGTSRVWATIGGGVLNEVFWPNTGRPQLRDVGFLVTGAGFWAEVKRVANYTITTPDPAIPFVTVVHVHDRYRLRIEVVCDPRRDCVLVRYRLDNQQPDLGALRLHVLAAPHLGGDGHDNNAIALEATLAAMRGGEAVAIVNDTGFATVSAGFVGFSDGWQDCNSHGEPIWQFTHASHGNVALTGTCPASVGTIAVAFAATIDGARTLARAALVEGFTTIATAFTAGWRQWAAASLLPSGGGELEVVARTSAMVLKAHEDLTFPGAIVASMATPWGFAHDDPGGYHLVWPRDCVETALALAAIGLFDDAGRVAQFLTATQSVDGHWPQNFTPDGHAYWSGIQLDETALPVILAVKLHELGQVDLHTSNAMTIMVRNACRYLAANAPLTMQDRWEETAGLSPFSIAASIAALAGAAASGCLDPTDAAYAMSLADWWNDRVEDLVYVTGTGLDDEHGTTGHYVRIGLPGPAGNRRQVVLANRDGETIDVAELVGLEFLALVRYGLRAATDPRIVDTVTIIDRVLRRDLPNGPYYHRYQHDGYGEHDDGAPFDGTGIGRLWPLLTGERGHHAIDHGDDPTPYLQAMARAASRAGLIPEQVWDGDPLPERRLTVGKPTGSATPLVWAHAEYVKLYSAHTRAVHADRLTAVADRYANPPAIAVAHVRNETDLTITAPSISIEHNAPFVLHVGVNGWHAVTEIASTPTGLAMHAATIPADVRATATTINWTRRDTTNGTWEGTDHTVHLP